MPNQYGSTVRWPAWSEVATEWRSFAVPEVEVRPWPNKSWHTGRWEKKETYGKPGHLWCTTSPADQTAYHLVKELPAQPEDVQIAYRLEAYGRENGLHSFLSGVVYPVYGRNGLEYPFWWHSNAKHVLPSDTGTYWPLQNGEAEEAKSWKDIVRRAAEAWRTLAIEWIVVRVPDLMDEDSEEYRGFISHIGSERDTRDRLEYERLRARFENAT